jgi:hypothetical protein
MSTAVRSAAVTVRPTLPVPPVPGSCSRRVGATGVGEKGFPSWAHGVTVWPAKNCATPRRPHFYGFFLLSRCVLSF